MMETSLFAPQVILTFILLATIAVIITFAGVLFSIEYGQRPNGWSNGVATFFLIAMTVATLVSLYELQENYYLGDDFETIYYTLIGWYVFLFFGVQRLVVKYYKKNQSKKLDNREK